MQVCLDYQPAVAQRAGIGRYTRLLARHLASLAGATDELRLFYLDFTRCADAPDVPGAVPRAWRLLPGALIQQLWKRTGAPDFARLAGMADLYHFPNFIIPPLARGRAVVSIHDMSFARFPECAEARNRRYLEARMAATIDRADAIITISQFSAGEIEAFHPEAAGKLHVTYLGIDASFARPPREAIEAARRRLGLERPYLLSVGTIEPRKQFPLLVEAFDALNRDNLDLVIAGMPGWNCETIFRAFAGARRTRQIRYLRYVPDGDLPALYAGAEGFALASRYEGFGFTPLEAMACGTPVVVSPGGSLAEVVGDAAMIVPEAEPEAWRLALARLLDDPALRGRLQAAGLAQAHRYRWSETARQTWDVYRQVFGHPAVEGQA
jgi:glycosyltransferase involved in cell wall biosynthesis